MDDKSLSALLADVQANILHGDNRQHAGFYFLRVTDVALFRPVLTRWLGTQIRSDAQWAACTPDSSLGFALSYSGLKALGVHEQFLARLPAAFRAGMAARATQIGDVGANAPENWESWYGNTSVHALAIVWSAVDDVAALWTELCDGAAAPKGADVLATEQCHALVDPALEGRKVEHFGFADEISQPAIRELPREPCDPSTSQDPPVAIGEFVLGHVDETERARDPGELCRNGSFMVLRKLEQDVARFWSFLRQKAGSPEAAEELAARVVGRRRDGTPIDVPPGGGLNDFQFGPRKPGAAIVGSHIRRANPRDSLGADATRFHRILRRGLPYGTRLQPGQSDDGSRRGLLFLGMNARIEDQFEFVQREWINGGNVVGEPSHRRDPLIGNHTGAETDHFVVPGQAPVTGIPGFVTLRGGEYFLTPSVSVLARIANAEFAAATEPAGTASVQTSPSIPTAPLDPFNIDIALLARLKASGGVVVEQIQTDTRTYTPFVYVARPDLVQRVLLDDKEFSVAPYDARIQAVTKQSLIVGLREGDTVRTRRRAAMDAAAQAFGLDAKAAACARATVAAVLAGAKDRLEVVGSLAEIVPLQRILKVFGVPGPNELPDSAIRLYLGSRATEPVPKEWADALRSRVQSPQVIAAFAMRAWTRVLFFEVFQNLYRIPSATALATLAATELMAHLEQVVHGRRAEKSKPDDLLAKLLEQCPSDEDVVLILLELIVGGTATVAKGVAYYTDELLADRALLERTRLADAAGLDQILAELQRRRPIAPLLIRTCAAVGVAFDGTAIPQGSVVVALTAVASQLAKTAPPLDFGMGPHSCWGRAIATAELRESLRALAQLPGLRRAAGPRGQLRENNRMPHSLLVRFDG